MLTGPHSAASYDSKEVWRTYSKPDPHVKIIKKKDCLKYNGIYFLSYRPEFYVIILYDIKKKILLQYTCLLYLFVYNRQSNFSVTRWLSPSLVTGLQI
jgi:hypothetical protein